MKDPSRELIESVQRLLEKTLADEAAHPVLPARSAARVRAELDLSLPKKGRDLSTVVDELSEIAASTPRTASPRFLNLLLGGRENAAVLGEILSAVLNNSMHTYKTAGPHILVERALLEHMAKVVGMPEAEGSFQAGGSLSNLLAVLLARDRAFPSWRGAGPPTQIPALYTSAESHYSIAKAAAIAGVGRDNLRFVEVDDRGRMSATELEKRIEADESAGRSPFFVNATAGTTVRGAFDPISELAEVAGEHGLWLHVDGAFGASVALSPRRRGLLAGVESADSLAWDPHKMMGVPLPCSVLLVRHAGLLRVSLKESAGYLFQSDDERFDPGTRSIHCGRHNDALKLWAAWRFFGDEGWEARIERQYELAAHLVRRIEEDSRLVLSEKPSSLAVCFQVVGKDSARLCRKLSEKGVARISHGRIEGRDVIRLVTVNSALKESDLDALLAEILELAETLP